MTSSEAPPPPLTVDQASAVLWTSRQPKDALRELHEALLRDSVRSYDPSNVFLAIQGASLRFLQNHHHHRQSRDQQKKKKEEEEQPSSINHDGTDISLEHWDVLQESLWAVAALARACVGPAWWYQATQQRRFLRNTNNNTPHNNGNTNTRGRRPPHHHHQRQSTPTALPDDASSFNNIEVESSIPTAAASNTIMEPTTELFSIGGALQLLQNGHPTMLHPVVTGGEGDAANANAHTNYDGRYRPIPEILPAMLLRFAANAIEQSLQILSRTTATIIMTMAQRMNLVEAQLFIVQQLCCARHQHHRSSSMINDEYDDYDRTDGQPQEWNIPGAHEIVGTILSHGLTLVCTGRLISTHVPQNRNNSNLDLLSFVVHSDDDDDVVPDGDDDKQTPSNEPETAQHSGGKTKAAKIAATLPPPCKDQWKHILLVARATTDLLSSGWRPLPRAGTNSSSEGADVTLALLVIASRGIKLDDLTAAAAGAQDNNMSSGASREERLAASSCAAQAISALLSLANCGLIPLQHQSTLVRAVCRLNVMLRSAMDAGSNELLYPPLRDDGLPSSSMEEDFFASQRELCLTDATDLIWAMLSNESSLEQSMEVIFLVMETAAQAISDKDSEDSPLFNKLKWNDHTDDYVLADCATVVRIFSSALWGAAPDFTEIPLLRIVWHSAIEAICKILSTIHSKFVAAKEDNAHNKTGESSCLLRSNYFTKQVHPLVVDAMAALEKVIEVELREGSGVLSSLDWEAIVNGIENAVVPWLEYSVQETRPVDNDAVVSATTNQIRVETESVLLRVAELLVYYVSSDDGISLMDYNCLRRLLLILLRGSVPLGEERAEEIEITAVHAWSKFGFFPYRLECWRETAAELLQEAFSRNPNGVFLHSAAVRLEALESLTFEETTTQANGREADTPKPQSLLVLIQHNRDLYSEIVSLTLLPTLRLILIDIFSTDRSTNLNVSAPYETHRSEQSSRDTAELEHYAVELAGRLFLSVSADRSQRADLVPMMKFAGLLGPSSTDVSVQLEGSRQLYLCLRGVFCDVTYAHESIPSIVDALCEIFKCTLERLIEDDLHLEETGAVCVGALRTLGRLQLSSKNRLAFLCNTAPTDDARADTDNSSVHDYIGDNFRGVRGVAISSFVRVGEDNFAKPISSDSTDFSFQTTTKEIVNALRKTRHKISGESNTKEGLISTIRRFCFDTLSVLLIAGVQVELLAGNAKEIFCDRKFDGAVDSTNGQSCALVKTLSRASQSVRASKQEPRDHGECLGLDLLGEFVKASTAAVTIPICRSLFVITVGSDEIFGESVPKDKIYGILQDRLEIELVQSKAAGENARLIASLLSVLHEAVSARVRPANSLNVMRTFESCLNIISKTYMQAKSVPLHIALRGSLEIIRNLTPDETRYARQQFTVFFDDYLERLGTEPNWKGTETTFAPMIVNEALDQQSRMPRDFESGEETPSNALLCMSTRHQRISEVSEQMDRFIVEAESTGALPTCAAWLCDNNVVLTCRVGSRSSRYRGHVEVVLRSPTIRTRSLIPMPGKLALEDPDFPSQRLSSPRSYAPYQTEEKPPGCLGDYKMNTDASSDIVDHAQSLVDRFDDMLSNVLDIEQTLQSDIDDNANSSETPVDDESLSVSTDTGSTLTDTAAMTGSSTPEPQHEAASANGTDDGSIASRVLEEPRENSVFHWFISTFEWDGDDLEDIRTLLDRYLLPHSLSIASSDSFSMFQHYKFGESKQLYYNQKLERAISILDRTTPCNTYKFGLLYFSQHSQSKVETDNSAGNSEGQLLGTLHCSSAFHKFTSELGTMTPTRHLKYYSAGLDVSEYESDGRYTLAWLAPDATSSVVFHVVNLMPASLNGRKRHIGNDNVLIIFVEEASEIYHLIHAQEGDTATHGAPVVSGQFAFATIFVTQLPRPGLIRVTCRIRAGLAKEIDEALSDFAGEDLVSEIHAADFVRGLAMRVDLACRTMIDGLPPPTNCLERCRKISELKRYAM